MIQEITNKDFLSLIALNAEMYFNIDSTIDSFGATNTLMYEINSQKDFIAIGLYEEDKLIGFVKGYCFAKKLFHFSGIYVKIKNNIRTKELIEYCFKLIENKGYSAWQVDATNSNISSIMEKYGAKAKYTRYIKEIANG